MHALKQMTMPAIVVAVMAGVMWTMPAYAGSCGGAMASSDYDKSQKDKSDKPTIAGVAKSAGKFNTLLAAAEAAGLAEALAGDGPFTVFAPTDDAFAALPEGTVESLLKPENRYKLKAILKYHIVPAKVKAAQVVEMDSAKSLLGQKLAIHASSEGVKIDSANVVQTDIYASNGVVHVIDSVLMPKNIVELAEAGQFNTLLAAVKAAGLTETLSSGQFTVFAPTDAAFAALPEGTVETLLKPENQDKLTNILTFHVSPQVFNADQVVTRTSLPTVQGQAIEVDVKTMSHDGERKTVVHIGEAKLVMADIYASNGVIHVIDTVLIPATETAAAN